ncbi:MAG: 3-hydroxyacyl-CoA dehydrogenase [Burkholderiales bacterium]
MKSSLQGAPVLVVGAGIMGAGIAQVAAQAGHRVFLFDLLEGAAVEAKTRLTATIDGLVAKGKLQPDAAKRALDRIEPVATLHDAATAGLVVEAIVERLDAKRSLFRQLEEIVGAQAILATNTSSISITAIANGLEQPGRLVGMHFFNPVPLMKLVEVVSGLQTAPAVADAIHALAQAWGKTAVHARSTPGFIVNRIARPYYAESLALLQQHAATPQALDACLRAAGFRMGPCELMDLIGHDTNFAVTQSVYEANFYDKRFVPSLVQRELVDGGLLGRKTGQGFYRYPDGAPSVDSSQIAELAPTRAAVVHGQGPLADDLVAKLTACLETAPHRERDSDWVGVAVGGGMLALTDGRTADEIAGATGHADTAVFDRYAPGQPSGAPVALAYALATHASSDWGVQARSWLAALGFTPVQVADTPALVVARTLAMLINEAADAVDQRVCTSQGADAAMKLGVNYPRGPFEWLADWHPHGVIGVLDALDSHYRGERYRVSPWLRRANAVQRTARPA